MKCFLFSAFLLVAVDANCIRNKKSYKIHLRSDNYNASYMNLDRTVYNKVNYLKHCKDVEHQRDRKTYTDGNERKVYGRKKRGDISVVYDAKWANGVVPFLIEDKVYSDCALSSLATAMTYFEETTCAKFINYVNPKETPRPLLVANFLSEDGNAFAASGRSKNADYDGIDDERLGLLGTNNNIMMNTQTMLHELAHVLNMNHAEDSERARAPYRSEKTIKQGNAVGPWYPLSVATNIEPEGPRPVTLTDWDIWTFNQYYNCTRTTIGGKPIDNKNQPPMQKYMAEAK